MFGKGNRTRKEVNYSQDRLTEEEWLQAVEGGNLEDWADELAGEGDAVASTPPNRGKREGGGGTTGKKRRKRDEDEDDDMNMSGRPGKKKARGRGASSAPGMRPENQDALQKVMKAIIKQVCEFTRP